MPFDMRPEHYFCVVLKNQPYIVNQNLLVVADGDPDPVTGKQRAFAKEVLARCVVSVPFAFDRGQSHSVSFSQPTTIGRIGLQLLSEDGRTLLDTHRQEISFTFGFVRQVRT